MGLFLSRRELKKILDERFDSVHRHIDFIHDDVFSLLRTYLPLNNDIELITEYPVAYHSNDHLHPTGTIKDNTRCPKFFWKCESLFPEKPHLHFLDLGCSSGGLVLDALLRGHKAIGLEGSNASLREQRAQWRFIQNNLFTCDITKPFTLRNRASGNRQKFDIISMWDVLEHIAKPNLNTLLENIWNHLEEGGIFVASISTDASVVDGVDLHVTKEPREWWEKCFAEAGFEIIEPLEPHFMPRGGTNPPHSYMAPRSIMEYCFGIAVRRRPQS